MALLRAAPVASASLANRCLHFFYRSIVWLEADQALGCFDQRRSQARIAMFGHAALYAGIAATVFPGVTANSPSIAEALPVADDRHSVTDVLTAPLHQSVVRDL